MVNQGEYVSEEEYDRVVLFHPYCSISTLNTMMKYALEEAGLIVNGQNFNNLRYADDACS